MTALVKSLWASIQGDPKFMRRVNGWLTLFWIAMIPISIIMGWLSSVVYVSALSLWALVSGHWSAWQAARVEVNQQQEAKKAAKEDLPGDVVDTLIERTTITAVPPAASDTQKAPTPDLHADVIAHACEVITQRCDLTPPQAAAFLKQTAALHSQDMHTVAQQIVKRHSPPRPTRTTTLTTIPKPMTENPASALTTGHKELSPTHSRRHFLRK